MPLGAPAMTSGPPRRVAFVHPDLGIGGAEKFVVDAAENLQKLGHSVELITSHFDPGHAFEPTRDGTLRVVHARTHIPRSLGHRFHLPMAILQQLSLVAQVALAQHGAWIADSWPALYATLTHVPPHTVPDIFIIDQLPVAIPLLRMLCGRRVIYYCHFPDTKISASLARQRGVQGWRAFLRSLYRLPLDVLEEITTRCSDAILVNSLFTSQHFHDAFPRITRTPTVVYPGVDESVYTEERVSAELAAYEAQCTQEPSLSVLHVTQALLRADDRPLFISINRFEAKKNIALALDTIARVRTLGGRNVRLVCAGGYDPRVRDNIDTLESLKARATMLGLRHATVWGCMPKHEPPLSSNIDDLASTDVIFFPSYPGALLHALLQAPSARALLYTPTDEHFGIVPLEAMACGLPVLATNTGGPLETVVDAALDAYGTPQVRGATGLLRPPNAEAWAVASAAILAWPAHTRAAIAEAARTRVPSRFSVRAMAVDLDRDVQTQCSDPVPLVERLQVLGVLLILVCFYVALVDRLVQATT